MTPNITPSDASAHIRKLDRATAAYEKTRRALDDAIADARSGGLPLTTISEHTPYSREWARKIANRVDEERRNACGEPNYSDRCELGAGHEGRHEDGIMSWPQGVERPVGPAKNNPSGA
ncbi:hypothetical protein ACIO6U_02465 [Streptomyces sp. NPDC087422]|uniref:hypothetical protein n=1 Tax=Streptomyces sp. NPDC087422 TaxID=3365786 RepID=UPI0037F58BD5